MGLPRRTDNKNACRTNLSLPKVQKLFTGEPSRAQGTPPTMKTGATHYRIRNTKYEIRPGHLLWPLGLGLIWLSLCLSLSQALVYPVHADGGLIQVAPEGQDQPDCGLTPAPVCKTIKYAVEGRAQAGDRIQVAPGVYTETFTVITSGLKIYGAGPELTIIDGQNARGPLVTFAPGLTHSTVFSGFSVQNGLAAAGGGFYLLDSSPTITASLIQKNTAITGGGLYITGSSEPTLPGNTICANSDFQLYQAGSGQVDARGIWWGVNSPQAGVVYSGTVNATPAISANLSVHPLGATDSPGTATLPIGSVGEVRVTMRGDGYTPPPGTQITLVADNALFPTGVETTTLLLATGSATAVITPTTGNLLQPGTVTILAFHACYPAQAVISTTISITGALSQIYLPLVLKTLPPPEPTCPTSSTATFTLIPFTGAPIDHPDFLHGDLNLAQRGYSQVQGVPLTLVDYTGGSDPNAPQLSGLFADQRLPVFSAAYQVNSWDWSCGQHGCPGPPLAIWPTTLIGMATTPGEAIYIPRRAPDIFSQGGQNYKAMVLYAEEKRITLGYTRDDSVATGYSVHLENVCVDPALLQLYRAQVGPDGFRSSSQLPALTESQSLGAAFGQEMRVAVRDRGNFTDPRSRKDWWPGFKAYLTYHVNLKLFPRFVQRDISQRTAHRNTGVINHPDHITTPP